MTEGTTRILLIIAVVVCTAVSLAYCPMMVTP